MCPTVLLQARHATGPGPREIWIGNNALVLTLVHDAKLYRRLYLPCIDVDARPSWSCTMLANRVTGHSSVTRPVYNTVRFVDFVFECIRSPKAGPKGGALPSPCHRMASWDGCRALRQAPGIKGAGRPKMKEAKSVSHCTCTH